MAVTLDAVGYLTHEEVASSPEEFTDGVGIVIGAGANLLIAMCNLAGTPSGLKLGGPAGVAMTRLGTQTALGSTRRVECWYLEDPTPGTYTSIEVANDGNPSGAIALSSWNDVDLVAFAAQTPVTGTFNGAAETLTTGSVAADGFAVDGVGTQWNDGTPVVGAGQTAVEDSAIGNAFQVSSSYEAGAGAAVTMSWTDADNSAGMAVILAASSSILTTSESDGVVLGEGIGTSWVTDDGPDGVVMGDSALSLFLELATEGVIMGDSASGEFPSSSNGGGVTDETSITNVTGIT